MKIKVLVEKEMDLV